eukprot:INCI13503.2.p1 GENE.INCI13503.2~~INCI13503.2.p1  ORF type:complete len:1461 (+),score=200.99 INCI13503.2:175-4557(+)
MRSLRRRQQRAVHASPRNQAPSSTSSWRAALFLNAAAYFLALTFTPLGRAEVLSSKSCPAGQYLRNEQGTCADCPAGTYGAVSGLESPECSGRCEPGYYCPRGSTSARQEACPAGTYGSSYGLQDSACSGPALEGYYTSAGAARPDQFECSTLENFHYCPSGSSLPQRVQLGYYATGGNSNTTRTGQALCEPGHYCPDSLGIMLTCPPGVYGSSTGLSTSECDAECGPGQYCPEASTRPTLCPAGTYNNVTGMSALSDCMVCPLGHFCVQESALPQPCPAGQFGDQEGLKSASCSTKCTSIASMDDPGNVDNIICVASQCEAGYFCPEGSVSQRQVECGHVQLYCPAGSSIPIPVDEGYYTVPDPGAMDNRANTSQAGQILCEPGHYCIGGVKYTCPKGTYGGSFGLSSRECSGECTPGYFCSDGATDSREKQCGNSTVYCPQGSFEVIPVSEGYYTVGYECPTSVVEFLRLSGDFPSDALGDDSDIDSAGIRGLVSTFTVNYNLVDSVSAYDALSEQEVLDMLIEYRAVWDVSCIPNYDATRLGGSGPRTRAGQLPCEPGFFCVLGTRFKCPAGSYVGTYGASECHQCPAGHYCPEQYTEPVPCPCGTYGQTTGLQDAGCSGICPAGYFCEEGQVGATEHPCGNEKVFCPLGSCAPTTVKPAFYAIGGSSRVTRTAQQKCDISNHLQRECPLGTVNSDFTCVAEDLLTDEWRFGFATGEGRVNGSVGDPTDADFDTGVYVGCALGYIQQGNDVYVHCEEEDTFVKFVNKSSPQCSRVSCRLADILQNAKWNSSAYTTRPLPQDIFVWWGETVRVVCADGYYDFDHPAQDALELVCDYTELQNISAAQLEAVTCSPMYCAVDQLLVGLWEWGYVAAVLDAQQLVQIPVPSTVAEQDRVVLSSDACVDSSGDSVGYVAVDGVRVPAASVTCGGLASTEGASAGDFASFEIAADSQYVHSLRIFVDVQALGEFEIWISDDNALMTPTYDATGAVHVVCAGPNTVEGLTAYQQKAVNTEIEVVCNSDGRFVRIQLLGEPRPLALREVEFYTGTFSPIDFSDTVGYEDIVAASCDDRFSPIDNDFQSQVVECTSQFSSFEEYDDTKKSTFCTINFCLVEDLTEEGSPMAVGHDVASASAVVAVGKTVDVTCTAGYWPKEVPDSAHYAPFDAFGEGKWWDEQAEVFQATCVPPMGFFNYSGPVCAPVQCEATDLLDGAWTASNGFTVSFGEKYLRSTAPALPAVNRTQNVSIICDPTTHRETADSSEPPQFSCDTPFSFISERTGLNDTHRAATGYACEPIECSKADLLSGHWRAGYVASPVTMSPLFQRSSGSVMALLEVDSISCDEDAGYFALGTPSPEVTCTSVDPDFVDYGDQRRGFWCAHPVSCDPNDLLTGSWGTGYVANYDSEVYLGAVVSISCDVDNGYSQFSGPESGSLELECASSVSFTTVSPAERNSIICTFTG